MGALSVLYRQAWPRLQQTARQAVEGARTLFDENLKHPLKAIKEILVDKPVSLPMEANAAASVEVGPPTNRPGRGMRDAWMARKHKRQPPRGIW